MSRWPLLFLVGLSTVTTADVLDDVRARGLVRIGTTGDYRPFSYQHDGRLTGIDIDLGAELARKLGVAVEWVPTSWPTLMTDLHAGRFDMAASGVSVTTARAAAAHFSTPYYRTGKTVLTPCGNGQRFSTLAQIDQPDVRVVVNPGGTNEAFVRRSLHAATILVHPDNLTVFTALADGAADLMITDAVEARLVAAGSETLCTPMPNTYFETVDKAVLLPRDDTWLATVNGALAQIRLSGKLEEIISRHVPVIPAQSFELDALPRDHRQPTTMEENSR